MTVNPKIASGQLGLQLHSQDCFKCQSKLTRLPVTKDEQNLSRVANSGVSSGTL